MASSGGASGGASPGFGDRFQVTKAKDSPQGKPNAEPTTPGRSIYCSCTSCSCTVALVVVHFIFY